MRRHPLKSCLANTFFALLVLPLLIACTSATTPSPVPARVAPGQQTATAPLHELSVHELLAGYRDGSLTAEAVTAHFLARIDRIDPAVNALIETNPQALAQARKLDRARAEGQLMGPLHGIPVILKANIDTADEMATSAGALALADHHAQTDAGLVGTLRNAGAILLAKANLSEWANFRDLDSISGWSSVDGQTNNPWRLTHNPCGSSSGSAAAVAARLAPLAVGTETNGSIVCPAGANGVLGLKPTMGRVSRRGIIPIAATQDIAGPMANRVADLVTLMTVLNHHDPADPASDPTLIEQTVDPASIDPDFNYNLGVWRNFYGAGTSESIEALFSATLNALQQDGFTTSDPINLDIPEQLGERSFNKMMYEFRNGVNAYLQEVERFDTLQQIIEWNKANAGQVLNPFGQNILEMSVALEMNETTFNNLTNTLREEASATLDQAFVKMGVTHLLSVTNSPAWPTDPDGDVFSVSSSTLAAISGYPHLTIPMGLVDGLPVGLSLVGPPGTEAQLLHLAQRVEDLLGTLPIPAGLEELGN